MTDQMKSKRAKRAASAAKYQAAHSDRVRAARVAYLAKHRERVLASHRAYYARNRSREAVKNAAYRTNNPEKLKRCQTAYKVVPANRMKILVYGAIQRAQRDGREASEALRDVLTATPPVVCACCNRVLDYSTGRGNTDRNASPSLDRVDNQRGYTLENTVVICFRCNHVKNDATLGELETVARYMRERMKR